MVGSDKKRVQFRAPHRFIDRADALADVLGEDRTDILVTALREYLQETTHDDALTQEIAAVYYDDEITFEQLKALVDAEEAAHSARYSLEASRVRHWCRFLHAGNAPHTRRTATRRSSGIHP